MDQRMMLRGLKGAPLSVLVALFMFGPASRQELMNYTGWKKGAVDDALRLLEGESLVVRPSYKQWSLSEGTQQLSLFSNYPLNGQLDNPQAVDNPSNYPLNGQLVISSSSSNNKQQDEEELQPDQSILDACREAGIFGKKRDTLARLPHVVTAGPAYVRDHVERASAIGLAIWRMEEGWSVPDVDKVRPLDDQVPERYRDVIRR